VLSRVSGAIHHYESRRGKRTDCNEIELIGKVNGSGLYFPAQDL